MKTARDIAQAIHALIQSRLPTVDEIEAVVAACQADGIHLTPEQFAAVLGHRSQMTTVSIYGGDSGDDQKT